MNPCYVTMTRRECSNPWSGGIEAHPAPKKFRVQKSARKFDASIFWHQVCIFLIDYLSKSQMNSTQYYVPLLVQLSHILKENGVMFITVFLFLHCNSPAYRAIATQNKLVHLVLYFLDHPPYSPDLSPSDCHLFPGLKKKLKGRQFSSNVEVIADPESWLDGQYCEFFL